MNSALAATLSGLGLGLSLIIAIGAQNAFVLRQGLRREHIGVVVLICLLSDAVLILSGVAGAGALVEGRPGLVTAVRVGGAAFLVAYGVLAARRALRPQTLDPGGGSTPASVAGAATAALALTWLNPHVYLDTVVLLGSIAQSHGEQRWWFAAGAVTGSALWFTGLGYGARLLRPLFARPRAWQVLDAAIALVMVGIAASLLLALR